MRKETPMSEAKFLALGKTDAWSPENECMYVKPVPLNLGLGFYR